MSKRILEDTEYTFNASLRTVTISTGINVTKENLLLITNTSANKIIYNFGCEGFGGTVSGQVITLEILDAGINSDHLQVILHQNSLESEVTEGIQLNTSRTEVLLCDLIKEQQVTNKYLRKIYNPE